MKLEPVYSWVLGTVKQAMAKLSRSLTPIHIGTPRENQGDRAGNVSALPAGKVAWPVDPSTHDGTSIIAADAFFAIYSAKSKEVALLDDINGKLHPGAYTLDVGVNVEIAGNEKRSGRGIVLRTAEYGSDGIAKNVFIPISGDLIAHHRPEDPPKNSTLVHDPGEDDDWAGGLHHPLRVRKFIDQFCKAVTDTDNPLYAPLFNFTRNGDGTVAHGAAHFNAAEACLSYEANGPLRESAPKHKLGETADAQVRAGAIDLNAYFGDGTDAHTAPIEFNVAEPWQEGKRSFFVTDPEIRYDANEQHPFQCGPRKGKWKLWDTAPLQVYDPPGKKPPTDEPPPAEPPPPTFLVPQEAAPLPSVATPAEVESPSTYAHPRPNAADAIGPTDWPGGGHSNKAGHDSFWLGTVGFTDKSWNQTPIVAHQDSLPVYESSTANDRATTPEGRWPTVKTQHELLYLDDDGRVIGRKPALGSGSVLDMPSNMQAGHALAHNDGKWPDSPNSFARIVFAAKSADGSRVVDGRFGLGRRITTSPFVASGFEFQLDYTNSTVEPDLHINSKNASAGAGGGNVYINGSLVGTGGGGDISSGSNLTSGRVVKATGTKQIDTPVDLSLRYITVDDADDTAQLLAGPGKRIEIRSPAKIVFDIDGTDEMTIEAGKVTITGLIDPTGLELTPVAANPGGTTANTLWLDSGDSGGSNPLKHGAQLVGIINGSPTNGNLMEWVGGSKRLADSGIAASSVYRAGGTDVAIVDGGTGASTADDAIKNLTNGATSRTPVLTDQIPFNDVGTNGGRTTPQALFNLVNSLTAETAPAYNDKVPLYDASTGQTDAVTIANLFGEGKAVVVEYTGSGSSGKTVTLTGINRAHYLLIHNVSGNYNAQMVDWMPKGNTGSAGAGNYARYSGGNATGGELSLSAPSAGSDQVLTINATHGSLNASGVTYRVLVIGTPT